MKPHHMRVTILLGISAALLAMAAGGLPPPAAAGKRVGSAGRTKSGRHAAAAAIPDSTLGLSKSSVFAVPAPDSVLLNPAEPGPGLELHRMHPDAPPVIPHGIADFLPITRGNNQCLDCHKVEKRVPGEPIPIPRSHYIDWRGAPGLVRPEIAGARYVCTSCHVPRTGSKPLVGNR